GYDGSALVLQQILVALGLLQAGQPLRFLGSAWESNTETALPEALSDPQRRDLSHLSCFSIDSASTQEVDDAIGLERRDGKLWIWIHIADPHQWVEPGDRLDLEAQRRGSTLYLSGGAMPMFPLAVARDCMSLKPMRRCAALSVGVLLSAEGAIEAVEPCRSWVKVSYGLTYDDADELIELAPPEDPDLAELAELLKRRTTWREQQGALLMEQAEGRLFRSANAELSLEVTEPGLARSCVSEAMILAGAAMAEWSSQHGLAMPFRVQAGSSQDNPEANQWPQGPVRWAQQRRGLSRSRLQSSPEPHGSLGLPMYLQWTSPIRRYSDLLAHRQWLQFSGHLEGEPLSADAIDALLQRVEQGQREASLIARQDQRMALLEWLDGPTPQWPQAGMLLSWLREDIGIGLVRLEAWAMELPAQIDAGPGLGDQLLIELERVDPASDLLRLKGRAG
ncbi:MAG: ribonuclease catalytic domain-containing protein, partial [Synechococcus sp.]